MRRLTAFSSVACLSLGLFATLSPLAQAYPEPAIVSPSWSLDIEVQAPEAISIEDVDGSIRWFWYISYTVVNPTDLDLLFIPEITIANDRGDILNAGENVPPTVFPAIKKRLATRCC